jgi:hypothetical protein
MSALFLTPQILPNVYAIWGTASSLKNESNLASLPAGNIKTELVNEFETAGLNIEIGNDKTDTWPLDPVMHGDSTRIAYSGDELYLIGYANTASAQADATNISSELNGPHPKVTTSQYPQSSVYGIFWYKDNLIVFYNYPGSIYAPQRKMISILNEKLGLAFAGTGAWH